MNESEWFKAFTEDIDSNEARIKPTEKNISGLTAVLCAIRVISETISSLKIKVTRTDAKSGTKEEIKSHPVSRIFTWSHDNGETNPQILIESLINNACLNGNGLAEIVKNNRLQAKELYMLESSNMTYEYNKDKRKIYRYKDPNNKFTTKDINYFARSVLHVPYFVTDGWVGKSPITLFRETLTMGLSVQVYGVQFFKNGGNLTGFLTKDGIIGVKEREAIRQDWKQMRSPIETWNNPPVLHGGLRYEKIGISPADCEFIVNRNLQVLEAARMYKVPPHLLGILEGMNYNNIEMQMINFITYTILRWVVLLENEVNLKCFTKDESFTHRIEFIFDSLLRGDNESRYQAIERQIKCGVLNVDEGRQMEGRDPLPNGIGTHSLVMASQLDTLERVVSGLSRLNSNNKNNDDNKNTNNGDNKNTNNDTDNKNNTNDNKSDITNGNNNIKPSIYQDFFTILCSNLDTKAKESILSCLNSMRKI